MRSDRSSSGGFRRGFMIGELLIALLLLAVAVSSLAALMYSVSRHAEGSQDNVECVGKGALGSGKCTQSAAGGASKLLRSGCATRIGFAARTCKDTIVSDENGDEVILRPRTDSASLAMIGRKPKPARDERTDRGFIR